MKIPYDSKDWKALGPWKLALTLDTKQGWGCGFGANRGTMYAYLVDQDGDRHYAMNNDVLEIFPRLVEGKITGLFKIRKHGGRAGLSLVSVEGQGVRLPTNDPALADALENVGYLEQANKLRSAGAA